VPLPIQYTPAAARDIRALRRIPEAQRNRIREEIEGLAKDPTPKGSIQIRGGAPGERRVRVGDYRIRYRVTEKPKAILITRVRHRREVYR
jgi:mRNA interferase RelE/StbE